MRLADNRSHPAFRRLIFDELLAQQLSLRQAKKRQKKLVAPALKLSILWLNSLLALLPFRLTAAQERTWKSNPRGPHKTAPNAPAAPRRCG